MDYSGFAPKARQNLTVAEWCYQQGHYDACCNRAYYAMYHAAIAVLASEGVTPTQAQIDHGWVQSQFVTHFCNRQKIFPAFRKHLQEAQKMRDLADYRPECINQRKARQQMFVAQNFVLSILARFTTP
jgi:uncharacterized protein (UPF0332 family)